MPTRLSGAVEVNEPEDVTPEVVHVWREARETRTVKRHRPQGGRDRDS